MAGDYYNSQAENPANRAANTPGILSQIRKAILGLGKDIFVPKKWQDRGSTIPFSIDILRLNGQETPPAAVQFNVPENPELRNSHQSNEPQFRFLGINTGQGGNKPVSNPIFGPKLSPNHTPIFKEKFASLNELLGLTPRSDARFKNLSGKKLLEHANPMEPSGFSSGSGSGSGSGSSGGSGGSSGGFHGGGRPTL